MSKKGRRARHAELREYPDRVELLAHDCRQLENLAVMRQHRQALEDDIRETVHHLRDEHRTPWEEIAQALGVTRQAVQKRYGT